MAASGGTLLLWSYGAARIRASVAGVLTAGIPAVGYAFAVLLDESGTWTKTAGGAPAIGGVALAAGVPRRRNSW